MARRIERAAGQVEDAVESLAESLGEALGDRLPALAQTLADRFPDVADAVGQRVPALARYTRHKSSSGDDALAFSSVLVFGALVGAVAAVFLAPSDGPTLRSRLQERVNDLLGYTSLPEPPGPMEPLEPVHVRPATVAQPATS